MIEHVFDFDEQVKMSHGIASSFDFRQVLLSQFPSAISIRKASDVEDRVGTDWWVERQNNKPLSVDLKSRAVDYGKDDLALETWSVIEANKIGWTRDIEKGTDYIIWFWDDTKRWCIIPFPMLCHIFIKEWKHWSMIYPTARQKTKTPKGLYHSECVFVPRQIVWDTIIKEYRGKG